MLLKNALAAPNQVLKMWPLQVLQRVAIPGMTHIMLLTTLCKVGHGVNIFDIIMSNATVMSQMLIVDSAIDTICAKVIMEAHCYKKWDS